MRLSFRYLGLCLACLLLTGCFNWNTAEKTKPETINAVAEPVAPFNIDLPAKNIALLLPLAGPLADAGQAVRDGFITAYHNDTGSAKPTHFIMIDTSAQPITAAYHKAVQANADMIIGPLEKNNVQTLVQTNAITLPTLALNYVDNNNSAIPAKLYQFGLSPLDEARQAAALAKQNGQQNAIILAPNNSWGKTLAQTYQDEWQALGGNVIATLYFSENSAELSQQIRTIVNTNKQKFDAILLAASPQMARQIKPLLKFYYADHIAVYATALVYTGTPQPAFDNDLNNLIFCDTPWTLSANATDNKLRQQIALFWPANFKQNARLYALGIDAYQLARKLPYLANGQHTINGATGNLFLNNQHLIVRQLTCAQFTHGVPNVLADNDETNNINNLNDADHITPTNIDQLDASN